MKLVLPIYYTKTFKTKPDKTFFVGLNWYRNAHHVEQNNVKKHYQELVTEQLTGEVFDQYQLTSELFYKNTACDGHNTVIIEKFLLDALQTGNAVKNDNVKHHMGTCWSVAGQDKENPRLEITIKEVSNGNGS